MNDFLRKAQFRLKVLSPVFIGGGGSINKKEFILPDGGKYAMVPDLGKMYKFLDSRGKAKSYEDFLLKGGNSLHEFLRAVGVKREEYPNFLGYEVSRGDVESVAEINTFVKDPYGKPYIPGSSLKGAIRTALLNCIVAKTPDKYDDIRAMAKNDKNMREASQKLEEIAFYKLDKLGYEKERGKLSPVHDIMRGLRISDSEPLSAKDLVLCQKLDKSPSGGDNVINILRECLKPGTEIIFPVTFDTGMFPYDPEQLIYVVKKNHGMYGQFFLDSFAGRRNYGECVVYLGGGVGYPSKTVTYPLFEKSEGLKITSDILMKAAPRHKHEKDVSLGVSPHMKKCTVYGGLVHEFGACEFRIFLEKNRDNAN